MGTEYFMSNISVYLIHPHLFEFTNVNIYMLTFKYLSVFPEFPCDDLSPTAWAFLSPVTCVDSFPTHL